MDLTPEIVSLINEKLGDNHIMLSYNWGVQDVVKLCYDYISSKGVNVWMDIMGGVSGDINAAMAQGVEGAKVIVPFMTEKYQASGSCKQELSYAKDLERRIVPIMAQKTNSSGGMFRATDWLGIITAGKMWIDFRDAVEDHAMVSSQCDRLLLEIANFLDDTKGFKAKPAPPKPPKPTPEAESSPSKPASDMPNINIAPESVPISQSSSKPPGNYIQSVLSGDTWKQIPGGLTRISKGKSGVWGVNAKDNIFKLKADGTSWAQIAGGLVQISSGAKVWGVNRGGNIYYYKGDNNWTKVDGALKNIDVSVAGHVWGCNSGDQIFRRTGDSWQHIDGAAKQVSVGEAGVWVVNSNDDIFYRQGTYGDVDSAGSSWTRIDGKLKWIASGKDIVVGVNSNDDIFYRTGVSKKNPTGASWIHVAGKLMQIDVDGDREVIGTNSAHNIFRNSLTKPQ